MPDDAPAQPRGPAEPPLLDLVRTAEATPIVLEPVAGTRITVQALIDALHAVAPDLAVGPLTASDYYRGQEILEIPEAHAWLVYAFLRDGTETELQVTAVDTKTGMFVPVLTGHLRRTDAEAWVAVSRDAARLGRVLEISEEPYRVARRAAIARW